ncbi:MAG: TssQ family T6SS-associated lipoprotein [Burkholderiales bacterium]|nr:TssQ family T6SS-associated lipoprotein [Burkholderiales bacterium]
MKRCAAAVALACVVAACATPPASDAPPAPAPAPVAPPPVREAPPLPPPPPPPPVTAQSELDAGIKSYEDGDYKAAETKLQSALEMGLSDPLDRARAHKYTAFMVCVNGREKVCRDEFRKVFEADPAFALAPAEAGHPIWSQVVRSVKAELARAKPKPPAK